MEPLVRAVLEPWRGYGSAGSQALRAAPADWASSGAIRHVFAQPFAGDEHPPGLPGSAGKEALLPSGELSFRSGEMDDLAIKRCENIGHAAGVVATMFKLIELKFRRGSEALSCYFHEVLCAIGELHGAIIRLPSNEARKLQMNHAEVSGLLSVGMHETDGGEESYAVEYPKMDQDTSHETTKFDVVTATSALYTDNINTNACLDEYRMSGIQPMEEIRFGNAQPFELQSKGMVADSEEESMPSSPDTSSTGYMEQNLQDMYDAMADKERPVVLSPAFITCGKTLHLEPHLTFSWDGIKIECLDLDSFEDEKMIALEWEISNIISISCKWAQNVGSAFITLLAGPKAETGNAGPVRVQFSLDESQWPRRQQKIWELGPRYQEIWKEIPSDDFTSVDWSIEPSLFFPRQYFSSTDDFEDIIYPQGDPDAVSISKKDVELLLPETFVNDTIIDFYIKYLTTRIESTEKSRFHFFNSFFFRKLADLDKDQGRAPEGRAAFLRVRKWTRKINVFEKDFLFIPVNFK
ncbi:uncharacterized protein C2845_PM07G29080 [Panicum miliaceum]|uniref:Ubiquitin-like protease family profile domain-containing protein n=1 Tax=Panicum miliaceum TaxID=4540 RepID=A0A3L6SLB2_PANMI|nr:uncharacterized protein C2845_PM07G29080 [Panicum miliaceum]